MSDRDELLHEIHQLLLQYKAEVPGRRRQWPESIKSRVLKLKEKGLNWSQISNRTGIPYYTVLGWRDERKRAGFELVKVVSELKRGKPLSSATVTDATFSKKRSSEVVTVTVTTPKGLRIEGCSTSELLELVAGLEARL